MDFLQDPELSNGALLGLSPDVGTIPKEPFDYNNNAGVVEIDVDVDDETTVPSFAPESSSSACQCGMLSSMLCPSCFSPSSQFGFHLNPSSFQDLMPFEIELRNLGNIEQPAYQENGVLSTSAPSTTTTSPREFDDEIQDFMPFEIELKNLGNIGQPAYQENGVLSTSAPSTTTTSPREFDVEIDDEDEHLVRATRATRAVRKKSRKKRKKKRKRRDSMSLDSSEDKAKSKSLPKKSSVLTAETIPRGIDGAPILPLKIGGNFRLISLGTLLPGVPARWSVHSCPMPEGYASERQFHSLADPTQKVWWRSEVIKGEDGGPTFRVTDPLADPSDPDSTFVDTSMGRVWTNVAKKVRTLQNRSTRSVLSGPKCFGFDRPIVRDLINEMVEGSISKRVRRNKN